MLLLEMCFDLGFTTPIPSVIAIGFPTPENELVLPLTMSGKARLMRKTFMIGAESTLEWFFTPTSGRCSFRLFTSLRQIRVPEQIEGVLLPGVEKIHCLVSNLRRSPDWNRTVAMN
jgi:hypothetical protein